MPFTAASFTSISHDTGDDKHDFDTQDTTLLLRGSAVGHGKLGVWLSDPSLGGGQPFLVDTVKVNPHDSSWALDLRSFPLPEGNYTLFLTDGAHASDLSSPLDTHSLVIDDTRPVVSIDTVEGNDVLSAPEAVDGLQVSGTATGADGETVAVQVRDAFDNVLFNARGEVGADGTWHVTFDPSQAATLTGTDYSIHARVDDVAGNIGKDDHAFTSTVCFMAGTMIRTPVGEVAVEELERGDTVLTADGRSVPVTWLGVQTVSRLFADPNRVWPIRIKAGALADNVPSRDLLISPDHAILVDRVLVQAGALVNGSSIVREGNVPGSFTYYHVETEDHSLILAHDVPAETFIDNVDRMAFDNWDEHEALYPQGKAVTEMSYPRAQSVRQVPLATRQRLGTRSAERFEAISA